MTEPPINGNSGTATLICESATVAIKILFKIPFSKGEKMLVFGGTFNMVIFLPLTRKEYFAVFSLPLNPIYFQ